MVWIGMKPVAAVTCLNHLSTCNVGFAVDFGKLKTQRERFFVPNFDRIKSDTNINNYNYLIPKDKLLNVYNRLHSGHEFLEKRERLHVAGCRSVSREFPLHGAGDSMQNVRTRGEMNQSETAIKPGIKKLLKCQPIPKSKEFERQDISSSRVPISSLRGCGNGGSAHSLIFKSTSNVKKGKKFPADSAFFSCKSFRELGCSENMIESLSAQQILHPSHIQALAFATVLEGKTCIIGDQSGSGKTLAYLLPVLQRLRHEELHGIGKSLPESPRVVILVPTAELARQVLSSCRSISKFGFPFRSMVATGGFRQRTQLESLQQKLDVLIATPGRFMFLIREGLLHLTNLRCVVLDEVDILYNNEEYGPVLQSLINSAPIAIQYLFVTATLPMEVCNRLIEVFPDCNVIMGPGMHHTNPNLEEILIDCSGDDGTDKTPETAFQNKKSALLQLVKERPVTKTIVFCNKIETCRKVENILNRLDRKGIRNRVLPFHAALAQQSQVANMEEFCTSQSETNSLYLVCTDRASRGIDFTGIDHVILFDFPCDPSEYVRRVGRTARGAGTKGRAFIFAVGKQVSLARRIIEGNRKGRPLHDVPPAYV